MFSIFFVPTFNFIGIPIRIEDFLIIWMLIAFGNEIKMKDKHFTLLIKFLIIFIFFNLVSISIYKLEGYNISFRDLNTVLLYLKSMVVLYVGYIMARKFEYTSDNSILLPICIVLGLSSLVAMVQYFDLLNMGREMYLIYGNEDHIKYGVTRAVGTLSNPNHAAYYHGVGFVLSLNLFAQTKWGKFLKYILVLFCLLGVLLTFSRTGMAALFIVWFAVLILQKKVKAVVAISMMLLVIYVFFIDKIVEGTRFAIILQQDSMGLTSFGNRSTLIWNIRLEDFFIHPFFGIGPAKSLESGTIYGSTIYDNTYFLLLITSGLVGFVFYTLFIFSSLIYFIKNNIGQASRLNIAYIGVLIFTLVFFISTDLIWDIKFVSFFYLMLGIFCAVYTSKNDPLNETIN